MPDNLFVDSNIWLYALMKDNSNKAKKANEVIKYSNIIISTQVINEICFNLRKKTDYIESELQQLINNFFNRYNIIGFTKDLLISASELRTRYSFSFWDSLIVAAAFHGECKILYSEDMQDEQVINNTLSIINPFK